MHQERFLIAKVRAAKVGGGRSLRRAFFLSVRCRKPANQYLLRSVFLLARGGGGVPAVQSAMQLAM